MYGRSLFVSIGMSFASAVGPLSAQTMANLKTCQNVSGDPDQQIRACSVFLQTRRAVGGRPAPLNALSAIASLRAGARMRKQQIDLAIEDYDLGLTLNPGNYPLYVMRGLAYLSKGDHERAIDDYDKGIRLLKAPAAALSEALTNRGLLYMEIRDYDRAMSDLNEAIRLNPKNAYPFNLRGQVFAIRGDQSRAEADYKSASQLNPNKKASFQHFEGLNVAWLAYLREIQEGDDFSNWSRPPLDAFRRQANIP